MSPESAPETRVVPRRVRISCGSPSGSFRFWQSAAGHTRGDLFPPDAVERAYEASQGVPRELNRIAKLALEFAWVQEYPEANSIAVDSVVRDLRQHQNLPQA